MIDYLIHLYAPSAGPFRSLSYLTDDAAIALMRSLYRPGSIYWDRFADPAQYLQARRQVEKWLRQEFIAGIVVHLSLVTNCAAPPSLTPTPAPNLRSLPAW
jgi:hypothetical protein